MGPLAIWDLLTSRVGLPLVVAALLVAYNVFFENPRVRQEERDLLSAESRAAAMAAVEKRSEDNVEISKFDKMQLCQELGGKWVDTESRCD